jgi:hypothetical protein
MKFLNYHSIKSHQKRQNNETRILLLAYIETYSCCRNFADMLKDRIRFPETPSS